MKNDTKEIIDTIGKWLLVLGLLGAALMFALRGEKEYAGGCFVAALFLVWLLF